jgi:cobalt/nickel transport system ATP-binding protein
LVAGKLNETAIEMENVGYAYPDGYVALREVNLKITRGERLAILGANGAGKSTLLMLMNGLYTPSEGKVNVLGMPVIKENLHRVRSEVGLVFQDPDDQLFSPTLWDDVCFGPLNMGLSEEEVKRRSMDALKAVGLQDYGEKPPHHLSIGEKKRAAIATVLAMQHKILVLDEPTANLDPKSRHDLINLLRSLHSIHDTTLITATHDVNFLPSVADKVCVLNKGRVIAEGKLREILLNTKTMEEASLELPIVTQLFHFLADNKGMAIEPLPLTVEEALSELSRRSQ